jgi:hypothetical protein
MVFLDCYRWYKFIDGTMRKQAVTLDDRVKQVSGTLIIKEARVEDSGKYLCVVNNSVGGESVETVLTVTGMQLNYKCLYCEIINSKRISACPHIGTSLAAT